MIAKLTALAVLCLLRFSPSVANHDPNAPHPLNACDLCSCFVQYTDRDLWDPLQPYAVAANPIDVTQDECLALCLRDPNHCKAVVFGLVGGRDIYTCELYESNNLPNGPKYTYALNTFVPRVSAPCTVDYAHFRFIEVNEKPNTAASRRKEFYQKLFSQPNPFNQGRRR